MLPGGVLLLVAFSAFPTRCDALDADTLVEQLARTPPATIDFVEARFSRLLVRPIVVAGELAYLAPQSLDRNVAAPYRERTSIRGGSVTVERDGERTRTFSLRRAPELRGLLAGLSSLLAGDRATLAGEFRVSAAGDEAAWRLDLAPRDSSVRRGLEAIVATGARGELRCLVLRNASDGATVMLLGDSAAGGIAPEATLPSLLERCGAE